MPTKKTTARARRAKRQGKSSSTQAGEFVREEMHKKKRGKRKSKKQAIAIGLSKARQAGVDVPAKRRGKKRKKKASKSSSRGATRRKAGKRATKRKSTRRGASR